MSDNNTEIKILNRRNFVKMGIGLTATLIYPFNVNSASKIDKNNKLKISLIYAEVTFNNCTVELIINDIPVARFTEKDQSFQSRPIAEYLISSNNKIEIRINPGPTPAKSHIKSATKAKNNIFISARLVRYSVGDVIDGKSGNTLTKISWKNTPTSIYPHIVRADTNLPDKIPVMSWQKTKKIDLARDYKHINTIIHELHSAFQELNSDKIFELSKNYYKDYSIAYPQQLSYEQWESDLEYDMKQYKKEKTWQLKKLNPDDYSLRVCANGHLVECIAKDWLPIIRSIKPLNDGLKFFSPAFIGNLDGKWTIIR